MRPLLTDLSPLVISLLQNVKSQQNLLERQIRKILEGLYGAPTPRFFWDFEWTCIVNFLISFMHLQNDINTCIYTDVNKKRLIENVA